MALSQEFPAAEVVVKKSHVEQYHIRKGGPGSCWALITVDSPHLALSINSDYGSWAYRWHNIGDQSFKAYLIDQEKDPGYLVGKLVGAEREFDLVETQKSFKEELEQRVQSGAMERGFVDQFLTYLNGLDGQRTEEEFIEDLGQSILENYNFPMTVSSSGQDQQLWDIDDLMDFLCDTTEGAWHDDFPFRQQLPQDCMSFFHRVYKPLFVPYLKAELAKEQPKSIEELVDRLSDKNQKLVLLATNTMLTLHGECHTGKQENCPSCKKMSKAIKEAVV